MAGGTKRVELEASECIQFFSSARVCHFMLLTVLVIIKLCRGWGTPVVQQFPGKQLYIPPAQSNGDFGLMKMVVARIQLGYRTTQK